MPTLLQLNTSLFSDAGQSSRLADDFVATWRAQRAAARIVVRDFAAAPVPHLTAEAFEGFAMPAGHRTAAQTEAVAYSDALIAELRAAEVVVIGVPMYNFGVPSMLKAYFDHVARSGVTFRYTQNGPVGLLGGRQVVVAAARGGQYRGTERDTQSAYLRDFLGFLGMEDVRFIYAEGLAMGDAARASALAGARTCIERLAA